MYVRLRRHLWASVAAVVTVAAGGLLLPTFAQAPAAVSITKINGQSPAGGSVADPVNGDVLQATGTARIEPGVLADAGSSSARPLGQPVPVMGLATFGTAPYTFAWSFEGSAARFANAGAQSTTFSTSGLAAGPVVLTLTVSDSAGSTDTDTVRAFLQAPVNATLVDHAGPIGPGTPEETVGGSNADRSDRSFDFNVPVGTDTLKIVLGWEGAQNDLDLRVDDPSDREDGNTSGAGSANPETISVNGPASGKWKALVQAFLNTPTNFTLKATTTGHVPDPTPALNAGGPYDFAPGEPQQLRASATGGTAPVSIAWDLDGDNVFEASGAAVSTSFGLGTHLVTVKATDGAGYEKRQTLGVRVSDGTVDASPGVVVIAIADSGLNVYHEDFRASTYRDPLISALTANFTKHPSTYLTGYPADAPAIDLTLTEEYHPAADKVVNSRDGRTTLAEVVEDKLYWIPGTKIVGAYDSGVFAAVNSSSPDAVPILDEDGHGTGSASVAVGNLYGFCPSCLLVVTETFDNAWEYTSPWIDIASNSFGSLGNVGFGGQLPPDFPKASAERGQLALYAAGNGNENAFVTPQQTYTSENLGPDWSIRVGANTTGSRKPILGSGKPVDIASFGSGDIPAADSTSVRAVGSHSGTSAATPFSAGVFGTVLGNVRSKLGDTGVGQQPGVGQGVIARGRPLRTSPYLYDGILTRTELVDAVFKTAEHEGEGVTPEYPVTTPQGEFQYAFEGYGLVEPASGSRAIDVLLGFAPLPERPDEDEFFAEDEAIRDDLWGDWGGGGEDSSTKPDAPMWKARIDPLAGKTFFAALTSPNEGATVDPSSQDRIPVAGQSIFPSIGTVASTPARFFPHRRPTTGTACRAATGAPAVVLVESMDRVDSTGDCEVGYTFQSTGIQPSEEYLSTEDVSFGSGAATGKIFAQGTAPTPHQLTIVLKATANGRTEEIGTDVVDSVLAPTGPVAFDFSIPIPADKVGVLFESVVLSVKITRTTSTESRTKLEAPAVSFVDLPLANVGAVPAQSVELSLDDPTFTPPTVASLTSDRRIFTGSFPTAGLVDGTHKIYARARRGEQVSDPSVRTIQVTRATQTIATAPVVQAQVTPSTGTPDANSWSAVTSTSTAGQDPFETWTTSLPIGGLAPGTYTLHTRVFDDGIAVATDRVNFRRTPPATGSSDTSTSTTTTTAPTTTSGTGNSAGTGGSAGGQSAGTGSGACARTAQKTSGYWMVDAAGRVYGFGSAGALGNAPVGANVAVDLEATPSSNGYWIVDAAGRVFTFGDAPFLGGLTSLRPGEKATSLSSVPCGSGYWIFTNRGRVVPFGDAAFLGDMSAVALNGPVLDSIATPTGRGYYMVASDGGIFSFGDAKFSGSMGQTPLNAPVQSLVPDSDDDGYWLVAADGGIFAFDAEFRGSMGDTKLNGPITGMVRYANGYLMVAEDGGIFNFSDEEFLGSLGGNPPDRPVTSVSASHGRR